MTMLSPSQKAHLYVTAAAQWGIHAPLLVALAQVQGQPQLPQGETGLGMTPAGSLPPTAVQDFGGQVQAAAQTLRHLLDYLQAWEHLGPTGTNLWDGQRGTYTAALVQRVAQGYSPDRHHGYTNGGYTNGGYTNGGYSPASGVSDRIEPEPFQQLSQQLQQPQQPVPSLSAPPQASAPVGTFAPFPISSPSQPSAPLAQLEPCNAHRLIQAYDWACVQEVQGWDLPQDWTWLDGRLQQVCQRLPRFYRDLNFQREALLSAAQVWLGQADREQLLAYWGNPSPLDLPALCFRFLQERLAAGGDRPLLAPPQREALILLVQRWHQWPSRLGTLLALAQQDLPATPLHTLDPALLDFVQRIPHLYRRSGQQREALTECFRLWQGHNSRVDSLIALGLSPQVFVAESIASTALQQATVQIDRALLRFIRHIPHHYHGHDRQRQALLRLVQHWNAIETQVQTIDALIERVKAFETLPPHRPDSPPPPLPRAPRHPPHPGTPHLQDLHLLDLHSPILPDSRFTWAEATAGGLYWPHQEQVLIAIVELAKQLQKVVHRLDRSLRVVRWYVPQALPSVPRANPIPCPDAAVSGSPEQFVAVNPQVALNPTVARDIDRHALGDACLAYVNGLQGSQLYGFLDPWWPGGLGWSQDYPGLIYLDHRGYRVRWAGTFDPSRP